MVQSRINIRSDGTLARAPVWMGLERGPQFIFWGPYLFKYYKTEYKVQKNMGITLEKKYLETQIFLARAPKFLHPAMRECTGQYNT